MKIALLVCVCALLATAAWAAPSLSELDDSIALLETQAFAAPVEGADVALKAAEAYATDKVAAATAEGRSLLAAAAKAGEAEAAKADAALPDVDPKTAAAVAAAGSEAGKVLASTPAAVAAAAAAAKANPAAAAKRLNRMRAKGLKKSKTGIYGGVVLGISKADSAPNAGTPGAAAAAAAAASAQKVACLEDVEDGDKNLYGQQKSFLKDIAAHFDEKDIFESKKARLEARLKDTTDRTLAYALRKKLLNLETWHQMMQKKFLMSSLEAKQHAKKVDALFDAHLPKEIKDQLAANKVAKKAGQKQPFPEAHKKALAFMKTIRTKLARSARLRGLGHKVMVRPEIDNPKFPSMDPISSGLRERRWRQVSLDDNLSTDKNEIEAAEKLVAVSHKQHGDFMDGPIAEPLLKGKLYNAKTEPLGVPNFLTNFPWPKHPDEHISMNEKVRVEQTDFTTY